MSCSSLFFQDIAFGLDFPVTDLDHSVTESRCNLFESLMSRLTIHAISDCCHSLIGIVCNAKKWKGLKE
jgi:hypothetical protein